MIRSYLDGDAEALADFENAQLAEFGIPPRTTPGEVRWWYSSGLVRDAAADSRLVFAGDGTLVAAGNILSPPAGGYRIFAGGGVDPAHRGQGLGRELFEWQLDRAAEIHAAAGAPDGWLLDSSADVRDTGRLALYTRYGLVPERWWFHMEMNPADARPAALPDGVTAAPFQDSDAEAVYHANEESFVGHYGFEPHTFAEWTDLMIEPALRRDCSLVARKGDEVVGFVMTYRSAGDALWIAVVGTRARWRRRGIAGALVADSLIRAATAGTPTAYLDVDSDNADGAGQVYERIGFRTTERRVTVSRPF
jgi:ribosomal protein S18 acetylase RimI-like enzyme